MIPRAKKNLHESTYHLEGMRRAVHLEDFEICLAAFVNSARSTTFVLQNEYKRNSDFLVWYGNPDNYTGGRWIGSGEEPKKTKIHEMTHDALCKFFVTMRNRIVKEGINGLVCSTHIFSLDSKTDLIDQPPGSSVQIGADGIYYWVEQGTSREDRIPAKSCGKIATLMSISDIPITHLDGIIPEEKRNIFDVSIIYHGYLKSLVEEWTGNINSTKESHA